MAGFQSGGAGRRFAVKIRRFTKSFAIPPVLTAPVHVLVAGCYAAVAITTWLVWVEIHAISEVFIDPLCPWHGITGTAMQ
jgi:hypothetical protein